MKFPGQFGGIAAGSLEGVAGVNRVRVVVVNLIVLLGQEPDRVVMNLRISLFAQLDTVGSLGVDNDVIEFSMRVVAEEWIVKNIIREAHAESDAGIRGYRRLGSGVLFESRYCRLKTLAVVISADPVGQPSDLDQPNRS